MERIARAFVQVVPERRPNGLVKGLRITKTTQTYPRVPDLGALVLELEIKIDDEIFQSPVVKVELDADPIEAQKAIVTVPVPEFDDEDEDDTEH